jgi:hypothetical protein
MNIQEYRKEYYRKNKHYLIAYQKWYYSNRRYEAGVISKFEIFPKPNKKERYSVKFKESQNKLRIHRGKYILIFE